MPMVNKSANLLANYLMNYVQHHNRKLNGLPQGATLSPTLYNIYTADGPDPGNCKRALFADDTAFYTSSRICATITKNLRDTFKAYLEYFRKWKITLNVNKTQAIFFTRRRTREIPKRPLYITRDCRVPWEPKHVKYLGVMLDKKLTFASHVSYVLEKTNKAISILYSLVSRNSALKVDNKLLLYKVALRPIFAYACPIFNSAAKTHLKKLQTLQNKALKMCLNVHWRTSTNVIHNEAELDCVREHFEKLTRNFLSRYDDDDSS